MKQVKKFLSFLIPKNIKRAYAGVILATLIFAVIAAIMQFAKIFNEDNFAAYMKLVFARDESIKYPVVFEALYFIILYVLITVYCVYSIYLCAKKDDVLWCALIIVISLIFIITMHLYITVLFQYESEAMNERMYSSLTNCCLNLAMIISAIAGIKMTYVLGKNKKAEVEVKKTEDGKVFVKEETRYYYVEKEEDVPQDGGKYWHYVDGEPTEWK